MVYFDYERGITIQFVGGGQEVDEFDTFYKDALLKEGYESVYIQRGNQKRDGCGIFFRDSK